MIMVTADVVITIVIAMINGNDGDDGRIRSDDCHNEAILDGSADDYDDRTNKR